MAKIRITPRYYELQEMDVAVEEENDVPMEVEQSWSPEPHNQGYERAASAEPEDHCMDDEADEEGEDDDGSVRRPYERAASVEPEELDARTSYRRAASVEIGEGRAPVAYKRATSLEPDDLRDTTMDDEFDVPKASRPAPPPPKYKVEDYINVKSKRKIPPSIYKDVMEARLRRPLGTTPPNVQWLQPFQRKVSNSGNLPTLRQGLVRHGIEVVERTRYFKDLDERDYGATMLDPTVLYKLIKDGVAAEQLKLTMEFVLSENPEIEDRTRLRDMVMERFLVDTGANIMGCGGTKYHFTHVNPVLCDDPNSVVEQALRLVKLFVEKHDIEADRVVVSIPANECGIAAAKRLRRDHGVNTNLTLVCNVAHAAACLETGTTMVSVHHEQLFHALKAWAAKTEMTASSSSSDGNWRNVWAIGAVPRDIRAISAYLRMHDSPTMLLVSHMRQLDDLAFLPDIDGVVLSAEEIKKAKELRLPFHDNPDGDAFARAQSIPYPSSYLLDDGRFLAGLPLSEKDEHVVALVMSNAVAHLTAYQQRLEEKVEDVLAYRLWVRDVDPLELARMYEDDVLKEQARQLEDAYLKSIGSPQKVQPPSASTTSVGFRMCESKWDPAFKSVSANQDTVAGGGTTKPRTRAPSNIFPKYPKALDWP